MRSQRLRSFFESDIAYRNWLTQVNALEALVQRTYSNVDIANGIPDETRPARIAAAEQAYEQRVQQLLYAMNTQEQIEFLRMLELEPPAFAETLQLSEMITWIA